jgi:hypothetical protein
LKPFRDDIVQDLAPEGVLEEELVQQIATDSWRLHRVLRLEAAIAVPRDMLGFSLEALEGRAFRRIESNNESNIYIGFVSQNCVASFLSNGCARSMPRSYTTRWDTTKTTAVTGEDDQGHIIYNRALIDFAGHYGFQGMPLTSCSPVNRPFRSHLNTVCGVIVSASAAPFSGVSREVPARMCDGAACADMSVGLFQMSIRAPSCGPSSPAGAPTIRNRDRRRWLSCRRSGAQ